MRIARGVLLCGLLALAACAAQPARDARLYDALGGRAGIERLVDALLLWVFADPRISDTFAANTHEELAPLIVEQLCEATGGPCRYSGRGMRETHTGLRITDAQFAAFVEDLQAAMDEVALAEPTQQELLALLAPMRGDIVGQ